MRCSNCSVPNRFLGERCESCGILLGSQRLRLVVAWAAVLAFGVAMLVALT